MAKAVPRSSQKARRKTVGSAANSYAVSEHIVTGDTATDSARAAHLRYVSDQQPGRTRRRVNDEFVYHDPHGNIINDRIELERIKGIAIPPAWKKV